MCDETALFTEQLRKSYGQKEVLKGVSLTVRRGCLFGFLGPNGAGKTTTMSILTGILLPDGGSVRVLGETMTPDRDRLRRRIGAVHDSLGLFEQLTGEEHLAFSASLYGLGRDQLRARSAELLELFSLKEAAAARIQTYSHGMKKKLALACALIHDPEVLFLDEPFEGMDALSARLVMDNLRALARRGQTIFLTSHILELVEKLCDEVAILADGRVAFQQDLAELRSQQSAFSLEEIFLQLSADRRAPARLSWAGDQQ
jgi:ABC-2 type transport system ATP-binding protein